jgi:hypothetical protein
LPPQHETQPEVISREPFDPVLDWAGRPEFLLGQYPAGYGLLGGGRNLLLESAQEATLMSVSTWETKVKPSAALFYSDFSIDAFVFDPHLYGFNRGSALDA